MCRSLYRYHKGQAERGHRLVTEDRGPQELVLDVGEADGRHHLALLDATVR